jgi:ubiquinone/menaquinone biosynthesis C-methylase UbiE
MTTSFSHDTPQLAEAYDRLSDYQFEGGKRLVERLRIQGGSRVLDVGCGTGRLAGWIASLVGARGSVVGIDPLAERIAIARSQGGAIRFEVGQAEDLGAFPDESFDVVCMSAVFHWVADQPKALAEARRVLRPGGHLGVTTVARDLVMASTVADVMRSVLSGQRYAPKLDLSALAIASRGHTLSELLALLTTARLELAELHVTTRERAHTSGEEVVEFLEASSFGNFVRIVPEEQRPSLRADLAAAFDARKSPAGEIHLQDWGTMLVATRPAA